MIRGLDQAAKSLGIAPPEAPKKSASTKQTISPEEVPMMYRAQVDGRCSLMFAGNNKDLETWKDEWVYPHPEQPRYQKNETQLGLDGTIYRIAVKFPFRLISNCGHDNIIRPILGKDGIPFLSGSSVKGIFRRACSDVQIKKYCGDDKNLAPSNLGFRFHGAYPIGDWAGTQKVTVRGQGQTKTEVRHRMLDVVHPQQERQLGSEKLGSEKRNATALASVSLYKPTIIFEFSSADPNTDWREVEAIFWKAIAFGVGGKTSTGYGLGGHNDHRPAIAPESKANVVLIGRGVSPTLRSDEPEFRPNLFKASLRGHFQRLLAGVVSKDNLNSEVNRLFGSSSSPGAIQLFWEHRQEVKYDSFGATKTFEANGMLHLNASKNEDVNLIEQVLKFAFIMGGFGKSWRRASHQLFHKTYRKFEIGCHWELPGTERSWINIKSPGDLKSFLTELHQNYVSQFGGGKAVPLDWREAWHPDRLSVYATLTKESKAINLFHHETYKTTLAIGGRTPHKEHPKKTKPPESYSHVWHRMLPIGEENFLEIITVFHAQREGWRHQTEGDQLDNFIQSLKAQGLSLVWGNSNPVAATPKKVIPNKVVKKQK